MTLTRDYAYCGEGFDTCAISLIESFKSITYSDSKVMNTGLEIFTCADCDNVGMDQADGFLFCTLCGVTKSNIMDFSAEWRMFDLGKPDISRCGMPTNPLLPNSTSPTVLVGGSNVYLKKLYKWNSMNQKDIAKYKLLVYLQNKAKKVGLSTAVINHAQQFAVQLCDKMIEADNIFRGKNRRGLVAACLYFSFKKLNCPRTIIEIASILNLESREVTHGINLFSEIFMDQGIIMNDENIKPEDLVPRYCNQLRMSADMTELVCNIANRVKEADIFPTSIIESQTAACILYVVKSTDQVKSITQKMIGDICGISPNTVVKSCKRIEESFEIADF